MRSNGAPVEDSWVILARMSRQRCACSRSVLMSPANWLLSCKVRSSSREIRKNRRERRTEFVRRRRGKTVELVRCCSRASNQFGGGQRVRQFAGLLGDLERIEAGDADGDHDRQPDAEQVDRRQYQGIVAVPWQRQMEKYQQRRAGDRQKPERDGQPDRQRRRRDQNRGEKQKRKRILQAAGEEQQSREFDDVQGQQHRRGGRLQPLHRVETDLQDKVEQPGQADNGHTGDNLDIEFEPLDHDEDGRELAERGEPAQPQKSYPDGHGGADGENRRRQRPSSRKFSRARPRRQIRLRWLGFARPARACRSLPKPCTYGPDGPMNGPHEE